MTFLFTPQVSAPVVSQLGLVAALAVHDAAVAATGSAKIQIKWPNDLLIDGAKFCGILAEVLGEGRVGIGIGVNLAHAPEDAPYAVAALGAGNPAAFLQQLMGALVNRLAQWSNGEGFAATRQDWMARALGVGEAVCSGELHGLFKGLAADGALVVQSASGDEKHVHAGEVRFSSLERIRNDKR